MNIIEDDIYVLNPCYTMRNDLNRAVLYSSSLISDTCSKNWISFLHPVQAMILSFFTYQRPICENIQLISIFLNKDEQIVRRFLLMFIENETVMNVIWNDHKILFPKKLIVKVSNFPSYDYEKIDYREFAYQSDVDLSSVRLNIAPLYLTFMITNTCVTKCEYCYADVKTKIKNKISTSRFLDIVDEAYRLKIKKINIIGGEVFLHKEWSIILKKIIDLEMCPEYLSTKYPLTNEIIFKLKNVNYINPIQVSLDSLSFEILSRSIGVNRFYIDNIKKGLLLLDQSGIKYRIATIITKYNCSNELFLDMFYFIRTLKNITDWRISPAGNSICINYDEFVKLKLKKDDINSLYTYIETNIIPMADFPILLNKSTHNRVFYTCATGSSDFKGAYCSALNNHMFILPDGKVTICEQLYWNPRFIIGDLNYDSLESTWNSSNAIKLANLSKKDICSASPCKECDLFESCYSARNRCWTDIIKAYGIDNWSYPDPRCAYAPPMRYPLSFE